MPFWFVDDGKTGRRDKRRAREDESKATRFFITVGLLIVSGLALICVGNLWPELSRFFG